MSNKFNAAAAQFYRDIRDCLRSEVTLRPTQQGGGDVINEGETFDAVVTVFNSAYDQDLEWLPRIVFNDIWVRMGATDFAEPARNETRGDFWYKLPGDKLFPRGRTQITIPCTALARTTREGLFGSLERPDVKVIKADPWGRLIPEELYQIYGVEVSYSGVADIYEPH